MFSNVKVSMSEKDEIRKFYYNGFYIKYNFKTVIFF